MATNLTSAILQLDPDDGAFCMGVIKCLTKAFSMRKLPSEDLPILRNQLYVIYEMPISMGVECFFWDLYGVRQTSSSLNLTTSTACQMDPTALLGIGCPDLPCLSPIEYFVEPLGFDNQNGF